MAETRLGFAFDNPDKLANNGWGAILTPDELRYIYSFGNELTAPNCQTITDETLQWYIDNAIASVERDLNVKILIKRYKSRFLPSETRDTDAFTDSEARMNGRADLSRTVDLSTNYNIKIAIDKGAYTTVDLRGASPTVTTLDEIISNINTAIGSTVAIKIDNKYLQIKSTTKGSGSYVELEAPSSNDATNIVTGLNIDSGYYYEFRGWVEGSDWDWEDPYDFKVNEFQNYIYVKLKRRPILSIEQILWNDLGGNRVLDLTEWMRPNYEKGSVQFFPSAGGMESLALFASQSYLLSNYSIRRGRYPDAFYIDYSAGFENVEKFRYKWLELVAIIGKLSAINLLADYGDGRSPGLASSSIGLAGISESFSTTQSATNALYGARILQFSREVKEFYKNNKDKYAGILLGAL